MSTAFDTSKGRWAWWLFRAIVTVHAVDAYLQALLAGRFLSGDFGMLQAHELNATRGVAILGFVQIAVAVLAWRVSRAPGILVVVCVALSGATAAQIVMGFDRVLGVHVPLGVAVIVGSTVLAVWAWRRAPGVRK